ncbi:uncharacterized protein LOC126672373 [Mercurialis annua]|uniref:uncharacterized protein LOC126672373 n=1 Tax=Mercurialis annua TaxID=3986 RepID=UPI00215E182F|nr:uncharacterized protein LOC126672373 [Mercurialis annua]
MIETTNPGSAIDIQLREDITFLYVFIALKASIIGWQHCKPVIVVDGTFLKAAFGGTLLVATTQDAAGKLFPLAFSVVDSENDASWEYFITRLKQAFGTRQGITIVHARELPITSLIMHLHDLQQEYSYKHRKITTDTVTTFATNHEVLLFQNYISSLKLQVKPSTNDIITVLEKGQKYTVNMKERTCTCKKFEVEEIPCQHAVAVLNERRIEPYEYCSRYYTKASMLATYSETMYPLEKEEEWIIP